MSKVHVLAQKLLGKASLEECNVQELKDLAERYPYYAPAQFLLLQKLKQEGSPYLDEQYQKAVLYYHNPLAFEHMISPERFLSEVSLEEKKEPELVQMTGDYDSIIQPFDIVRPGKVSLPVLVFVIKEIVLVHNKDTVLPGLSTPAHYILQEKLFPAAFAPAHVPYSCWQVTLPIGKNAIENFIGEVFV